MFLFVKGFFAVGWQWLILVFSALPFRSCEDELYGMAVLLAERYKLPLWDICMAHLEYLFSDSGYVFQCRRRGDKYYLPLFGILLLTWSTSSLIVGMCSCVGGEETYTSYHFDISVAPLEYLFFNILQSPWKWEQTKSFKYRNLGTVRQYFLFSSNLTLAPYSW